MNNRKRKLLFTAPAYVARILSRAATIAVNYWNSRIQPDSFYRRSVALTQAEHIVSKTEDILVHAYDLEALREDISTRIYEIYLEAKKLRGIPAAERIVKLAEEIFDLNDIAADVEDDAIDLLMDIYLLR